MENFPAAPGPVYLSAALPPRLCATPNRDRGDRGDRGDRDRDHAVTGGTAVSPTAATGPCIEELCGSCGTANAPGSKFCIKCALETPKVGLVKIVRLISGEAVAFRLKKCDRCCCQPRKGRERRIFPYVSLSFPSKFPRNHPLPMALQGGHNQDVNERPDWRRPLSASASTTASQSSYIRGLDSGGGPRFGMDAMQGMTIISVQVCR